jgi:hypothetical protein
MDAYHTEIVGLLAEHRMCRGQVGDLAKTVYGNGSEGLKIRLTRLEERDDTRRKGLAVAISVAGIMAGLTGAFGAVVLKWALGVGG